MNEVEWKLKRVDEGVVAVDSRASSWALSSSPGVDEIVEGCVTSSRARRTQGHVPQSVS